MERAPDRTDQKIDMADSGFSPEIRKKDANEEKIKADQFNQAVQNGKKRAQESNNSRRGENKGSSKKYGRS